jgi:hypothetical protein
MKNSNVIALKNQVLEALASTAKVSVIAKRLDLQTEAPDGKQKNWFVYWLVQDMVADGTVRKSAPGKYVKTGLSYLKTGDVTGSAGV